MNILAFDTAMAACSAAVLATDGAEPVLLARVWEARARGHAEILMSRIEQVMDEAALGFGALDRIAVTVGPGTFTGVRIGVAAARGMALALGIEATGVTTLEAIARGAQARTAGRPLCVAIDARRGELYVQCFDAALRGLSEPAALPPRQAAALASRHGCIVVGTGAAMLCDAAGGRGLDCAADAPLQPDALHVALAAAGRPPGGGPPEPLYLRAPDAKLPA
jgi:tRNA threonylcarbamoyladenosine biosynthesis protein TsaB